MMAATIYEQSGELVCLAREEMRLTMILHHSNDRDKLGDLVELDEEVRVKGGWTKRCSLGVNV
jgi:hypothetical protein